MKDPTAFRRLAWGVGMVVGAVAGPAHAQLPGGAATTAARADVLQEVVVSARKREESVQEVPLTVNAFTAEQIEERGIGDLKDLASNTPGLIFFTPTDRTVSRIAIRGMSQVTPAGDTTRDIASVFIDGVYYSGQTAGIAFDDIERVEVIKGPQSAYFGRATFAGAINFITKKPSDEFEARIDASAAEYYDYGSRLSVNVPLISETLAMRAVAGYDYRGGQYKDANDDRRLGTQRDAYGVLTTSFTPGDAFSALLRLSYTENTDGAPASQMIARRTLTNIGAHNCGPFANGAVTNLGRPTTLYCGELHFQGQPDLNFAVPSPANTIVAFDEPRTERDMFTATLNLDIDLPAGLTLTSLSSYQTEELTSVLDFDRTNIDAYWSETLRDQDTITQEFRLASDPQERLRWMLGAYYLDQDYYTQARFIFGTLPAFGPLRGTVGAPQPNPKKITNEAVFASIGFDVTDKFEVSLEGRYQEDKVESPAPGSGLPQLDVESNAFLPRILLSYQADEDTNLYLNVARGNQPTQGNPLLLFLTDAQRDVLATKWNIPLIVPEAKVLNYEIGLKKTLADGRAIFNTALFYAQWKDKQDTKTALEDFNGDGVISTTASGAAREAFTGQAAVAGDQDIYGIEVESRFLVTDAFEVGLAAAYSRSKFANDTTSNLVYRFFGGDTVTQTATIGGRKEGFVPDFSATAYVQYRAPLSDSLDWSARADGLFVGTRYESLLNGAETGDSFDLNVAFGLHTENWSATLWVKNVFDDDTLESINYQGDSADDPFGFRLYGVEASLPNKRQVGINMSYSF